MKLPTPKISTIAVAISIMAVLTITYVQHPQLPGAMQAESTIREVTRYLGLLLPLILVVLAYRAWTRVARQELSVWRNGLGFSSMVVVCIVWLFYTSILILGSTRPGSVHFFNLEWLATLLYSNLAASLLAIALKGVSRTHVIAAALFVWAYIESDVYR